MGPRTPPVAITPAGWQHLQHVADAKANQASKEILLYDNGLGTRS